MKSDYYCVRSDEEHHCCTKCDICYCKEHYYYYEGYEPSIDEMEEEYEQQMLELEYLTHM